MIYCVKKGWPSLKDLCLHGKFGRAKSFWRCATTNHVNSLATTERNKLKSLAWLPLHTVSFFELYFESLICPYHSILKGSSRICPLFAESSGRDYAIVKSTLVCEIFVSSMVSLRWSGTNSWQISRSKFVAAQLAGLKFQKTQRNLYAILHYKEAKYRRSPTSKVSTSTNFQKVLHKVVLVGDHISKFVLVELTVCTTQLVWISHSTIFSRSQKSYYVKFVLVE